jgi:hypothetical protein
MAHIGICTFRISTLSLCIAALCPAIAFPQASTDVSSATTSSSAQAHVYVGTSKGVYLYDAASNGSLSLVSGSPFTIAGSAAGSNGKYFVSLGTAYLHSYPVASNGAIKGQVSQINTQAYSDSACGPPYFGVFDHSGQDIYVQRGAGGADCNALQSFKISSTGAFTFLGATEFSQSFPYTGTPLALTGNNDYGFSSVYTDFCSVSTYAFHRQSSGAMMFTSEIDNELPTPPGFVPAAITGDPINHLAISGSQEPDYCSFDPAQIASYTVDASGNLSSTNTAANIPTPLVFPSIMNMSPSGQFLAVGGEAPVTHGSTTQTAGLQVFRFNGANPVTAYSGVLTTAPIDAIHWDNNNHLYALSYSTKRLYAYTVTSSSITAVPGSPYTIASTPNALVVVPISTACSAPPSAGVHICAPASGSTVSSPVLVQAASTVNGTIARMELWVDGVKKYTSLSSKQLNTSVSLASGSHRFAVLAVNTAGQQWEGALNATVK